MRGWRGRRPPCPPFGRNPIRNLRGKLTYSNVISTLCLILIVGGGTAYAASHLPRNSVGSRQLKKGAVTAANIQNGAVRASKLGDGAVTNAKLADGSVNGAKLGDGAVTNAKLADGSVNGSKIADGSLSVADLAPGTVPPGVSVQGGFSPNVPSGSSLVYPIGQTSLAQGSAVAPVDMTVGNFHLVASSAPAAGEGLTMTLFAAPPGNPAGFGPTAVTCTVVGPSEQCSSAATALIQAGALYAFIVNRGPSANGVDFGYTVSH